MKKNKIVFLATLGLVLIIVLTGLLVACGTTTTVTATATSTATATATVTATVQPIELKLNLKAPPPLVSTVEPFQYFCSEVEKRTNGRVKITLYLASALAKASESYDAVVKGVADISDGTPNDTPGRFPASAIADLPFKVPSVWVAAHALNDWYNEFKPAEFDEVQVLFLTTNPPALLGTADKAVRTVEDIKGLSIRTPGDVESEELKAWGAVPRSVSSGEINQALSKGNIDGCLISPEAYPAFKLNEVINYVTDISDIASVHITYVIMNKDKWNMLSADEQQIMQDVAYETMEMRAKAQDSDLVKNSDAFKATEGKTWITLTPDELATFQAAIQSVVDSFMSGMEASGLPAMDYANYIRDRLDYWIAHPPQ